MGEFVVSAVRRWGINTIVTFDEGGVSGHRNHIHAHRGVRSAVQALSGSVQGTPRGGMCARLSNMVAQQPSLFAAFGLVTTSVARKYAGVLDVFLSMFEEHVFLASDVFAVQVCTHSAR